jgi:hypothetical protein
MRENKSFKFYKILDYNTCTTFVNQEDPGISEIIQPALVGI